MHVLSTRELRDQLADAMNRVAYKGERIILTRQGKEMAALVPMEDLRAFQEWEDRIDVEAANAAMAEWEAGGRQSVPVEDVIHQMEEDRKAGA